MYGNWSYYGDDSPMDNITADFYIGTIVMVLLGVIFYFAFLRRFLWRRRMERKAEEMYKDRGAKTGSIIIEGTEDEGMIIKIISTSPGEKK